MKKLLMILLMLFSTGAAAECLGTITWVPPVQNTDNTALVKCANQLSVGPCLRTFNVYSGNAPNAITNVISVNDRNAVSYTYPSLAAKTWYFTVTAVNGNNTESDVSNVAIIDCIQPKSPTNPTVTMLVTITNMKAFKIRFSVDGMEMVQIGKVTVGTVCDTRHNVDGYSIVPRAAVTMASSVDPKPTTVYAQCF